MSLRKSLLNGIVPKLIFAIPVAVVALRSEEFWENPKLQIIVVTVLMLVFFGEVLIWIVKKVLKKN